MDKMECSQWSRGRIKGQSSRYVSVIVLCCACVPLRKIAGYDKTWLRQGWQVGVGLKISGAEH